MADAGRDSEADLASLDRIIERTDALIADVVKIDPVTAILLGLAKQDLIAHRAVEHGEVLRFKFRRPR
jgi:hypothetical protein